MLRALVVVGIITSSSIASAGRGGAIAIPPLRIDLGSTTPLLDAALVGPSSDVLVGVHWASLAWRPTSIDVGVGYVGSSRPLFDPPGPGSSSGMRWKTDDELVMRGIYLTLARTITRAAHLRSWVDVRGELMRASMHERSFSVLGGAVRVSAELFGSGAVGDRGPRSAMMALGTVGVGLYVEASHRDLSSGLGGTGVSGGLSVRVPLLFAIAH